MVRVASPPQSRSKAVVCISTPRRYPRSGYFLVIHKLVRIDHCYQFNQKPLLSPPLRIYRYMDTHKKNHYHFPPTHWANALGGHDSKYFLVSCPPYALAQCVGGT